MLSLAGEQRAGKAGCLRCSFGDVLWLITALCTWYRGLLLAMDTICIVIFLPSFIQFSIECKRQN